MSSRPGKQPVEKDEADADHTRKHHDAIDEAEEVRSNSQTAQDREHTIRGGDNRTAPMKEFPT
jgi:hypothetical protein